jgi:hypothetical protein
MVNAILNGLTLGLVLAISVGPVIFTIIKQSLNNGKEGGFSFVIGVWLSDAILIFISNVFSELVSSIMKFQTVLAVAGSIFLFSMGVYYLFFKKIILQNQGESVQKFSKKDMLKILSSGFLINTLNPSVFLFWLGTATAFASQYGFLERITIFSVCLGVNIGADSLKVLLAGKLRSRLTLHNLNIINKISGSILIAFGISLLIGTLFFKGAISH